MASAKAMGLRRKRHEWIRIQGQLWSMMRRDGHAYQWLDMTRFHPNAELLDLCLRSLPFRAGPQPSPS